MQIICCRYGKRLSGDAQAQLVSHGLCDACAVRLLSEIGVDRRRPIWPSPRAEGPPRSSTFELARASSQPGWRTRYPARMDLQDFRDWILIAGISTLSLVVFVLVLIYAFLGYKSWRAVRALNRLSDEQLRRRLLGFNERFGEWIEADVFTISGLAAAGMAGVRKVRERRKPKRRRFVRIGGAVADARERLPFGR